MEASPRLLARDRAVRDLDAAGERSVWVRDVDPLLVEALF